MNTNNAIKNVNLHIHSIRKVKLINRKFGITNMDHKLLILFPAIQDQCCLLLYFWVAHIANNINHPILFTVKPVLSGHLNIDKTKVLMENGSLMEVKSLQSILQYF